MGPRYLLNCRGASVASERLKFMGPVPEFVGPPHRAAFLLPKDIRTLAKMLVMSAMPVFLRAPMRTAIQLPKKIGAHSNDMIQAFLRLGHDVSVIPIRFQLPAPTDMHPGG
jgi:hypothetical protein